MPKRKVTASNLVADKLGSTWTLSVGLATYKLSRGSIIEIELSEDQAQELAAFGYEVESSAKTKKPKPCKEEEE